jgi:tetratricopeptide (TPR) repeat protein
MTRGALLVCLLATGCVAPPVVRPAEGPPDHLALAADALDLGEDAKAAVYLSAHLYDHPDEAMTRATLAELLFQQGRHAEARQEFEQFVATAQPLTGPPRKHLVHAHTRLVRIAEETHDVHAEQLHRGIGLFTLVSQWDTDPSRRDEAVANETLAKAARALRAARRLRPDDARANLYLALTYARMGQPSAARAAWKCVAAAPPVGLTPWEAARCESGRGALRP